jgi:hypothetical protein
LTLFHNYRSRIRRAKFKLEKIRFGMIRHGWSFIKCTKNQICSSQNQPHFKLNSFTLAEIQIFRKIKTIIHAPATYLFIWIVLQRWKFSFLEKIKNKLS